MPSRATDLPVLVCPRVGGSIRVDGDVHKAPWTSVSPVWLLPSHGRARDMGVAPEVALACLAPDGPPLAPVFVFQPTAVRVCRTAAHLHVAFQCLDRDVWGTFEGRNQPIYTEEAVEAFLAPGPGVGRYFELETSPRGAFFEARIESPEHHRRSMVVDTGWVCAGWERAVRVRGTLDRRDDIDHGWSVEWAIPFASLGVAPPRTGDCWRANFTRIDQALGGQYSAWSPTGADPPDFHLPLRFGVLEFA